MRADFLYSAAARSLFSRALEEQILDSSVQIHLQSWIVNPDESGYEIETGSGLATVMNENYAVTHNHFAIPLTIPLNGTESETYRLVILADSRGEKFFQGPLAGFKIAWQQGETLVLTHKNPDIFRDLGFHSAEFQDMRSLQLAPGTEVAQVDWDGETARIDWVTVRSVLLEETVPCLVLADDTRTGASGGGIFLNGKHIGHNWLRQPCSDEAGHLIENLSTAALNSDSWPLDLPDDK